MSERLLTLLDPAGGVGRNVIVADGSCCLIGRKLDTGTTLKLDKLGQRRLTDAEHDALRQQLLELEVEVEKPSLSMESFRRSDDLLLSDEAVSHLHAMLFNDSGRLWVSDLASTNGTFVNGARAGLRELMPRDVLSIGGVKLEVRG